VQEESALGQLDDLRWELAQKEGEERGERGHVKGGVSLPPARMGMVVGMRAIGGTAWREDDVQMKAFKRVQELMQPHDTHLVVLGEGAASIDTTKDAVQSIVQSAALSPMVCPVGDGKSSDGKSRCYGFEVMQSALALAGLDNNADPADPVATAAAGATAGVSAGATADDFVVVVPPRTFVNPDELGRLLRGRVDPEEALVIGWAHNMPLYPYIDDWYQCTPPAGEGAFRFAKGAFVFTKAALALYSSTIVSTASEYAYMKRSGCIDSGVSFRIKEAFVKGTGSLMISDLRCSKEVPDRFRECTKLLAAGMEAGDSEAALHTRLAAGKGCLFDGQTSFFSLFDDPTGKGTYCHGAIAKFVPAKGQPAQYMYTAVSGSARVPCAKDGALDTDDAEMLSYWMHAHSVKPVSWVCIAKDHKLFNGTRPMLKTYSEPGWKIAKALERHEPLIVMGDMPPAALGQAACMVRKLAEDKALDHKALQAAC
jgi:hypothetical protein